MSHLKNKVEWCLKKGEREFREKGKHRGIRVVAPDLGMARQHVEKAEHYLRASLYLRDGFSDISASTIFYSAYHSLLAVLSKFGYESRNQECTFVLIYDLIESEKLDLDRILIEKISSMATDDIVSVRERYQYGVSLSMKEELFEDGLDVVRKLLGRVKEVLEDDE